MSIKQITSIFGSLNDRVEISGVLLVGQVGPNVHDYIVVIALVHTVLTWFRTWDTASHSANQRQSHLNKCDFFFLNFHRRSKLCIFLKKRTKIIHILFVLPQLIVADKVLTQILNRNHLKAQINGASPRNENWDFNLVSRLVSLKINNQAYFH